MKIAYYLSFISNLNLCNNDTNISEVEQTIKKLLAFVLIYCFCTARGKGIMIGILY